MRTAGLVGKQLRGRYRRAVPGKESQLAVEHESSVPPEPCQRKTCLPPAVGWNRSDRPGQKEERRKVSVHVNEEAAADVSGEVAALLADLNPQQRRAVLHEGTPLLIVAGAGSGKTAVLTRRIAYLLAARGVGVGEVLAITFTNKAAAEMRERVAQLVGPRATAMWVATFHSTCVRILRSQAALIPGLNSNFSIYDADDSRRLLLMIGRDMGLDVKRYSPRLLATAISNLKNELVDPDQALRNLDEDADELSRTAASVYGEYQRRLRAANALDFDDLIGETVGLLQAFPPVAQHYRRRFRHILVDEYQDTNHAQYMLVRELAGHGGTCDTDADAAPPAGSASSVTPTSRSMRSAGPRSATSKISSATTRMRQRFCWNRITAPPRPSCRRRTR